MDEEAMLEQPKEQEEQPTLQAEAPWKLLVRDKEKLEEKMTRLIAARAVVTQAEFWNVAKQENLTNRAVEQMMVAFEVGFNIGHSTAREHLASTGQKPKEEGAKAECPTT